MFEHTACLQHAIMLKDVEYIRKFNTIFNFMYHVTFHLYSYCWQIQPLYNTITMVFLLLLLLFCSLMFFNLRYPRYHDSIDFIIVIAFCVFNIDVNSYACDVNFRISNIYEKKIMGPLCSIVAGDAVYVICVFVYVSAVFKYTQQHPHFYIKSNFICQASTRKSKQSQMRERKEPQKREIV